MVIDVKINKMIGRIGAIYDNSKGDKKIIQLSIAENRYHSGKNHTQWFNFAAFNITAELILKHLQKGDLIYINDANIKPSTYMKNGVEVQTYEMIINSFEFVPNSNKNTETKANENTEKDNDNDNHTPSIDEINAMMASAFEENNFDY